MPQDLPLGYTCELKYIKIHQSYNKTCTYPQKYCLSLDQMHKEDEIILLSPAYILKPDADTTLNYTNFVTETTCHNKIAHITPQNMDNTLEHILRDYPRVSTKSYTAYEETHKIVTLLKGTEQQTKKNTSWWRQIREAVLSLFGPSKYAERI